VYLVLREDGPATQAQIRAQTLLPDRTARSALARLEDEGLLEKRRVAGDATKTRYSVVDCERG
jgi:DNA-binding MarR family transcriptional regulator